MTWTGKEYERCVSKHDITNMVVKQTNFRVVDNIVVEDEGMQGIFYIYVRLRWWIWFDSSVLP